MTRIPRRILGVTALLALAALLVLHAPPAAAEDPPVRPFLRVVISPDPVYTFDQVRVRITSMVWHVDELGNVSLVNSYAAVNITLVDVDADVVLLQEDVRLFNGSIERYWHVDPAWTSTLLNVTVFDFENGLAAAAEFRTKLSDRYLVYLITEGWFRTYGEFARDLRAATDAQLAVERGLHLAVDVTLFTIAVLLFLKREHRMAHEFGAPSIWDRFTNRVWPFSLVQDEVPAYLDLDASWSRRAATFWRTARADSAVRFLEGEARAIEKIRRGIEEGKVVF